MGSGTTRFSPENTVNMVTRDRPAFFEQAMRCFQRQTYDQAELIVLDDGQQSVEHLPSNGRERSVVVWCCFLILLAGGKQLRHSGHGWKTGGTLCFPRETWKRRPFRDLRAGYDS